MIFLVKKQPTFLFYDYETFGIHTSLDKPAQFACIRTDVNFNIIDDPKCFYCFPSDDYFPDPESILITHITPQYTHKKGTNEYNFSKKIYNIFMEPNTCIIGYNNIHFDDEITRNIFYRNFFDPYEWSWKNGNSRWDIINLLRACYALRPDGINWPKNKLGLTSFKLSDLTAVNNITHVNVHDAMSDVYATLAMTKLVKKTQPKLFDFFFKIRQKNELSKLIEVNKNKPIIYISNYFGAIRHNISFIFPIYSKNNQNVLIAFDLYKDVNKLINLCKKIYFDENFTNSLFRSGIVLVHLNRCPTLAPIQAILKKDFNRLKFNDYSFDKKISFLKKNDFFIKKIQKVFFKNRNIKESLDVDLRIYDDFFNSHDKKIINIIRNTQPIYLKKMTFNFHDCRLKELFFRYRARNFFHTLDDCEKRIWLKYCISLFNPVFLKEYHNKIQLLLIKHVSKREKVKLLTELLNYVLEKYKKLFNSNLDLN